MKSKRVETIVKEVKTLNMSELNEVLKRLNEEDAPPDFRYIKTPLIISGRNEEDRKIYNLLIAMEEEEWTNYLDDMALYGVDVEYDNAKDEFKFTPSIS